MANPILTQLAADITTQPAKLPGNATLEIRNQSPASDKSGANDIDLYTDNGTYYWGHSKSNLVWAIAQHEDDGQGEFKRAIAAALIAVKGDVTTARAQMAVANLIPGTKPNPAAKQAAIDKLKAIDKARGVKYTPPKPLPPQQQKEQTDSFIWLNSIVATMPNVKVTHTTTTGQPTLTLSDSWPDLAGGDVESLVINAGTGLPVASFDGGPDQPSASTYYHTSRVTLANVEAGKF